MPHKIHFSALHASSIDTGYSPKELESHNPLVKGWQSAKFCPFPQEIILKLPQLTRVKKLQLLAHQYLIPTKVEVYIGSVPPDNTVARHGTRYKRLGYVTMSDNQKTSFKARELKSVHIDAVGQYIRLVLHKSYINKQNLYNQVGIIAINVLGDEVDDDGNVIADDKQQQVNELISRYMPNGQEYHEKEGATTIDPAVLGAVNNPEFISPMDDLAFDMYQDPEVAQIIRKLDLRKNEAVLREEYEVAKRLKQAIVDLQKVGEKIGRYEVEKRRAIETEDYDLAQAKKTQMDEYRAQIYKQIELHDLLGTPRKEETPARSVEENPRNRSQERSTGVEVNKPTAQRAPEQKPMGVNGSATPVGGSLGAEELDPATRWTSAEQLVDNEERPLPTLAHSPRVAAPPPPEELSPRRVPYPEVPDQELHLSGGGEEEQGEGGPQEENPTGTTGDDDQQQLPKLTPKVLREASAAIDVFGEGTVSKLYGKSWSSRTEGADAVRSHLTDVSDTDKEHLRSIMRVTVFLIKKLLKDGVIAVFRASLDLTTYLVEDWLVTHKLTRHDTAHVVENILPELMARIVDTNTRLRQASVDYIVTLAKMPEVRTLLSIPTHCTVPFKPNSQVRMAVTRVEIVIRLLQDLGIKHSGMKVDTVMTFALRALEHIAGEVRDAALQLIFELYKTKQSEVRARLPSEEHPKTLKNPLYLKIFDGFNRIDGKPTRAELKAQAKKEKEEKKRAKKEEIENLQKQLADLRAATQAAAADQDDDNHLNVNNNQSPRASSPLKKGKQRIRAPSIADQSELGDDDQCVFCGEKNDSFKDGGMDVHYWKQCPMLKKCHNCKQVVEISGQVDHLLTECESRSKYAKCPRCSEAHEKTELQRFVSEKLCEPFEDGMARCPLCETKIPANDESWKSHLMGPKGCPSNPRKEVKKGKPAVKDKKGGSVAAGRQGQRKNKAAKGR